MTIKLPIMFALILMQFFYPYFCICGDILEKGPDNQYVCFVLILKLGEMMVF